MGRQLTGGEKEGRKIRERVGKREGRKKQREGKMEREGRSGKARDTGREGRRKERTGGREGGTGNATQASPQTAVAAKVRMNKSYETMELWNSICFLLLIK